MFKTLCNIFARKTEPSVEEMLDNLNAEMQIVKEEHDLLWLLVKENPLNLKQCGADLHRKGNRIRTLQRQIDDLQHQLITRLRRWE